MAMAVFRREGSRLLPSIAARPIPAIRSPLSSDQLLSFSSSVNPKWVDTLEMVKTLESQNIPKVQAEAFTSAISDGLDSLMQKLEEKQSTLIREESQKLHVELEKMKAEFASLNAKEKRDQESRIHEVKEDLSKAPCDLRNDYNSLRVDFEATKYQGVKYAILTLGSTAVAGLGLLYFFM